MDTLLDVLQHGRLIELPDNNKERALQFLAHILEAIPQVPNGTDVVGGVMAREQITSTALGKGWACPHARVPFEKELMCVVGWSPAGIDYGAPDGQPVSIVAMYLVPANQRNHYLREVSILAKALEVFPGAEALAELKDLDGVRHFLLDLVTSARATVGPDAQTRMIRLQAKPGLETVSEQSLANLIIEPVTLVASPSLPPVVLTQNPQLVHQLDAAPDLIAKLEAEGLYQSGLWRLVKRSAVHYQAGRILYDCLAFTATHPETSQS